MGQGQKSKTRGASVGESDADFLDRCWAIAQEVRAGVSDDRETMLRARCAEDEDMLREVRAMLAAEEHLADDFLAHSVADHFQYVSEREQESRSQEGRTVGPWLIEEPIGFGGMGAVYRGRRTDGAYEKEVAIKFIRSAGPADLPAVDPDLAERFLRERQILATLDHPNIARLIDGGVLHDQPYLVMEYVRGTSLLEYCEAHQLTVDQRLNLFDTICKAVQYAHANLIVHRDLKPANILVNESGEPKLLDFGIAKALDATQVSHDEANRPPHAGGTLTADRRFTPRYAAPEQLLGRAITVATDVYALGLILYEMLVGQSPHQFESDSPLDEARIVCEVTPAPPSRRVHDDGETSPERRSDAARLRRQLRGDLDHIVMFALRKEPTRRYASVEAIREDIRRFREGLPITARADSFAYRTTRFAQRHRAAVTAAAAAISLLITATILSSTLALRLNERSRDLAAALDERQLALDEANARRLEAIREFNRTLSSRVTLINTIDAVASQDEAARQRIVDEVRARIDRLDGMSIPLAVEAEIASRQALAILARAIEAYDLALDQNRRIIELTEDRPEEAQARREAFSQIGRLHIHRGEGREAIAALRQALEYDRQITFAVSNPGVLSTTDLSLIEAMLMAGELDEAAAILREKPYPPGPGGASFRKAIADLEARFGVFLASP